MEKCKQAQITIRDLNKMDKKEVKSLVCWLRTKANALDDAVKVGEPWLVTRRSFAGLFHYSLMK